MIGNDIHLDGGVLVRLYTVQKFCRPSIEIKRETKTSLLPIKKRHPKAKEEEEAKIAEAAEKAVAHLKRLQLKKLNQGQRGCRKEGRN